MTVFISKENNNPKQAIKRIIDHFKDKLDLSRGVFLKPNIVFPVKEKSGEVTRHIIVKSLVEVLRELDSNIEIVIGEGTAAGSIPEDNFKTSGYLNLTRELGVELLNLDEVEHVDVGWKYGKLKLPKIIFEKAYINLPILKRSSAAGFSGAMKNQKGLLLPNLKKGFHKLGLHEPIAQLNKVIQPAFTIMDGINFFKKNVLIAGDNTCEIDSYINSLFGVECPDYIKLAKDLKLFNECFKFIGDMPEGIKTKSVFRQKPYKRFLRLRLWSNPRACSMCRFVFLDLKQLSSKNVQYSTLIRLKLFLCSLKGTEVIFGEKPNFDPEYKNVICFGNCTKKIAKENSYINVPGCPPTKEDILKYL